MKKASVGEILQRIYDSEIHMRIGWMWDGGLDYAIGATCSDLWWDDLETIQSTGEDNIEKAINSMADEVAKRYPSSAFAKWWKRQRSNHG